MAIISHTIARKLPLPFLGSMLPQYMAFSVSQFRQFRQCVKKNLCVRSLGWEKLLSGPREAVPHWTTLDIFPRIVLAWIMMLHKARWAYLVIHQHPHVLLHPGHIQLPSFICLDMPLILTPPMPDSASLEPYLLCPSPPRMTGPHFCRPYRLALRPRGGSSAFPYKPSDSFICFNLPM